MSVLSRGLNAVIDDIITVVKIECCIYAKGFITIIHSTIAHSLT